MTDLEGIDHKNEEDQMGAIISQEVVDQRWTDIEEDFEAAQTTSSDNEMTETDQNENGQGDTSSDYDCYHPSRCVSEENTPERRFQDYRGTPERTFSLTSTNVLTSPNNIVLINPVHRGQARGT